MAILAAMAVPHPPLIVPEVGHGAEQQIAPTIAAYQRVMERAAALRPDTVVILSPHTVMYADYFHVSPGAGASGSFAAFRAPQVQVATAYDSGFCEALVKRCREEDFPAGTLGEKNAELDHGTMIPLYFLQQHLRGVPVVRIGLSGLPARAHYRLGQHIAAVAEELGRRVLIIASGDLSHKLKADGPYGFTSEGPVFDARMQAVFRSGDFLRLLLTPVDLASGAAECGLRSFWIMAGTLDGRQVKSELLSYQGTFGVGYGVGWFLPGGLDDSRDIGVQLARCEAEAMRAIRDREDSLVKLARLSLETFVRTHQLAVIPEDMRKSFADKRRGAFVSLKKDGQLRGCIGTIQPVRQDLAEEILYNAVSAGTRDPRFSPVTPEELAQLVYDVDVLTEPEPIDSPDQLDVKRYGVIVQCGDRRGLLLPDLPGVDSVEEQISIARRKGSIGEQEPYQLWRFEVERHV
ncbi:AmmeMemoRadiSam system protein A [Selenomonas sp. ND2010]|uniref:AmmeMemoRadiSam system protein A n=1 Tax=Selenomonas sp. ND2010 TaxID=1410618 RepID=UPI00051BD11C|nr:AmmeMemoRadiSam system protein A [Selenomonas sp. ND2010]